ncbi:hypothetical protein AVEN_141902-1 [Araneus ventricosus]|uniref:Uncharacterized protein n=1 Tax=Araneus ventricosus TaxID=182803 RepID=A0A4Y1ZLR1_ARAVE|nr:hypothetical protein AVEN_141902-1 [Araneus ventricosus]
MSEAGHPYLFQKGNFGTQEGKNIRQGRKPMENSAAALKSRISKQTKLRQNMSRFFGEILCEASRHIKRLRSTPCYPRSRVSKSSCRGGKQIALPYSPALWNFR